MKTFTDLEVLRIKCTLNYRHAIHKRVKRHQETDETVQKLNNASRHYYALLANYFSTLSSLRSVNDVHKQVAFKNFHRNESKVIFHMLNRNKQVTKICFSKLQKLSFGEEVSSSPDKTENLPFRSFF